MIMERKSSLARAGACSVAGALMLMCLPELRAATYVYLTEVPDYQWEYGCFGTATGNLIGFWDRHGLPDFYTGPTAGGVAPLRSEGANAGIRSMWSSQAGFDGRPADKPGHINDYWIGYESTSSDPYVTAHRVEHAPDCIGDFIGLNQKKWADLNNECAGNIDGYSFVFWEKRGNRRNNFYTTNAGVYIPDIASGLKEWARYRGYDADVFTQLSSFNPERKTTNGFTYEDVKTQILAGYPLLCMLQPTSEFYRNIGGMTNANPEIHGVMIYGLFSDPASGYNNGVVIRTSWGSGDDMIMEWSLNNWLGLFPVRGVIGFHPKPKVRRFSRDAGNITLTWDGPSTQLHDQVAGTNSPPLQRYTVQRATQLSTPNWTPVGSPTTDRTASFSDSAADTTFYRVVVAP
jgi:hypothetical protein